MTVGRADARTVASRMVRSFARTTRRCAYLRTAPCASLLRALPRSSSAGSVASTTRHPPATLPRSLLLGGGEPPRPSDRLTARPSASRWGYHAHSARRTLAGADSGVEVDERVAAFRDSGPWVHLDHAGKQGTVEPGFDFIRGDPERATTVGAGGGPGVAGEKLKLGGAWRGCGELDRELLDRAGGWSLLEPDQQRGGDPRALGRRILERRFGEPGSALLEGRAHADHLHPPAGAARVAERLVDEALERVGEEDAVGDRGGKVEPRNDGHGDFTAHDRV